MWKQGLWIIDDEGNEHAPAQPDWYILTAAAKALGMSAPELHNLPEPERTYWLHRGLLLNNAQAKAWNIDHPAES